MRDKEEKIGGLGNDERQTLHPVGRFGKNGFWLQPARQSWAALGSRMVWVPLSLARKYTYAPQYL